jgi:pyruvate dehydrogenase E1 component alpha subunit
MGLPLSRLVDFWRVMVQIRCFEEAVSHAYYNGKIPGFIHVCIGQEAVAAGVGGALRHDDYIYVTHRGHGHCLAKGAEIRPMMAELYGKETGYCQGRGGSMHIAVVEHGVMGTNGIVGGSFPLAVGAAYAIQVKGGDQVVAVIFGEGSVNEGTFHEALNISALWKLPVVFICENNGYAQFTPIIAGHAHPEIYKHAIAYDIQGARIDGNDVGIVYETVMTAVEKARRGEGPTLIECMTYRWHGHYEGDPELYRDKKEIESWKEKDPIETLETQLRNEGYAEIDIAAWRTEAQEKVDDAIRFADNCPSPDPKTALLEVYI